MIFLHFLLSSTIRKSTPVEIRFKCPVCEARDATGQAWDQTEQYKFLLLIPLGTIRTTWVKCTKCRSDSRAEIPVAELRRQSPGEIYRYIRRSLPPLVTVFLVLAVPALILPIVELVLALVALAAGWKFGGWVRKLAIVEVTLGVILNAVAFTAMLLPPEPPEKPTFAPIRHDAPPAANRKP